MSFIRNYLTYATANEAPTLFHVWGAYICLAATVGRRVCFVADDGYLYPHLYVLFVGKAGNGKGEAMRKVKRVLAEVDDIFLSGNVETPEGFIRFICGNPGSKPPVESPVRKLIEREPGVYQETTPITIFATEFVNFIAMNPEGWINLLNDVWDADLNYHYRTKGQGEDIVPGPSISMIGALTTTMAADLQKQRIIGTGLGRRTIFQFGERQWNNPVPRRLITEERLEARAQAVAELRRISKFVGVMRNTPETDEWWDEWYSENLRLTPTQNFNVQSWYASKPDIVIKLAMLTALSEGASVIDYSHYETVLGYLSALEEDLPRIFGGVGRNELADVALTMLEYLRNLTEPVSKSSLKTTFFAICKPPSDFEDCMNFLIGDGKVEVKLLQVRDNLDLVVATPEVMAHFASVVASMHSPSGEAAIASPSAPAVAAHPPSELLATPAAGPSATPAVLAPGVSASIGQLPKVRTEGD